jgi:hypothetical protein
MRKGTDLILGVRGLKDYLHVGMGTLNRLVAEENFPVYKIRQGTGRELWVSSKGLVEEWIRGRIQHAHTMSV